MGTRDHDTVKLDFSQSFHNRVHIPVAIVQKGLDKVRQRRTHITKVDLEDLFPSPKVVDGLQHILAHQLGAFEPATYAEADADIGAIGDLEGPLVAFEG